MTLFSQKFYQKKLFRAEQTTAPISARDQLVPLKFSVIPDTTDNQFYQFGRYVKDKNNCKRLGQISDTHNCTRIKNSI